MAVVAVDSRAIVAAATLSANAMSLADLSASPALYGQKYDAARDAVYFVRLDEAGYRAASFLDDRILADAGPAEWIAYSAVAQAMRGAAGQRPLHFIFHAGHVGSTLLSRLIDETGTVLGLREPLTLRTLAEMHDAGSAAFDARLATFLALWRRGFERNASVVVKATSTAGRIAPEILAASTSSKAVYLSLKAEPYLATILAGANAMTDLKGFEAERNARLSALLGTPDVSAASIGEMAAKTWLTEGLTRARAMERCGDRILPLDFDTMLANLPAAMSAMLKHFGIAAPGGFAETIARSPILTRYSKAPRQFEYSPQFRAQLLAQTRREQAGEIAKGLRFLEKLAKTQSSVAALLS
jgi:hypothetical protein